MTKPDEIVTISDPVRIVPVADDVSVVRVDDEATDPEAARPRHGGGPVVTVAVWIIFALHRLWLKLPPDAARRARDDGHVARAPLEDPFERPAPSPARRRGASAAAVTADEDSPA